MMTMDKVVEKYNITDHDRRKVLFTRSMWEKLQIKKDAREFERITSNVKLNVGAI